MNCLKSTRLCEEAEKRGSAVHHTSHDFSSPPFIALFCLPACDMRFALLLCALIAVLLTGTLAQIEIQSTSVGGLQVFRYSTLAFSFQVIDPPSPYTLSYISNVQIKPSTYKGNGENTGSEFVFTTQSWVPNVFAAQMPDGPSSFSSFFFLFIVALLQFLNRS